MFPFFRQKLVKVSLKQLPLTRDETYPRSFAQRIMDTYVNGLKARFPFLEICGFTPRTHRGTRLRLVIDPDTYLPSSSRTLVALDSLSRTRSCIIYARMARRIRWCVAHRMRRVKLRAACNCGRRTCTSPAARRRDCTHRTGGVRENFQRVVRASSGPIVLVGGPADG